MSNTNTHLRLLAATFLFLVLFLNQGFAGADPDKPVVITAVCNEFVSVALNPATNSITLLPEFIDDGSYDTNGPISSMSVSPDFFDCSNAGQIYVVTLTVNGPSGSNQCLSQVEITEKVPPIAICESDIFVNLPASGTVTISPEDVDAGSYDNCSGAVSLFLSPTEASCQNLVNPQVVTLTVSDNSGNTNICYSTIHVEDNMPPVAICESDVFLSLDENGIALITFEMIDAGSYDNCYIQYYIEVPSFDCEDVGTSYVATLELADFSQNQSSCLSTVHIVDNNPDSDCDGPSDVCDVCPGANDLVDNNNDGLPDCGNLPPFSQVLPAWKCGSQKVLICKSGKTKCVNYSAAAILLEQGAYLGPCSACAKPAGGNNETYFADDSSDESTKEMVAISREGNITAYFTTLESPAQVVLIDNLGRVVATAEAGAYTDTIDIDSSKLPAGIYHLSMRVNGELIVRKTVK